MSRREDMETKGKDSHVLNRHLVENTISMAKPLLIGASTICQKSVRMRDFRPGRQVPEPAKSL